MTTTTMTMNKPDIKSRHAMIRMITNDDDDETQTSLTMMLTKSLDKPISCDFFPTPTHPI